MIFFTNTKAKRTCLVLFQLLNKDAAKRLGSGSLGSEEIKRHKWFKPINWKKLDAREIQPSFRPEVAGKHCIANFDKCWTDMKLSDSPAASPKTNTNPFVNFTYVRPAASFLKQNSPLCQRAIHQITASSPKICGLSLKKFIYEVSRYHFVSFCKECFAYGQNVFLLLDYVVLYLLVFLKHVTTSWFVDVVSPLN